MRSRRGLALGRTPLQILSTALLNGLGTAIVCCEATPATRNPPLVNSEMSKAGRSSPFLPAVRLRRTDITFRTATGWALPFRLYSSTISRPLGASGRRSSQGYGALKLTTEAKWGVCPGCAGGLSRDLGGVESV